MVGFVDDKTLKALNSWRKCPAQQQPTYPDQEELQDKLADLRTRPPLVFAGEVDSLKKLLGEASQGRAFALTGGDCAETFAESTANRVRLKIQTILQMAIVLTYGASLPIIKMGRMAGQYAKPRSSDTETRDGLTLPSYRGDAVNSFEFTLEARTPNPSRLLDTYTRSGTTLNLIRAFTQGGYADLHRVHEWNRGFTSNPAYKRFDALACDIDRAISFMDAAGVSSAELRTVDFYSAHESLLLEYEQAMTRVDSRTGNLYDTSAHFLWIGERTRQLDGAHVEQLSQVSNPLGVKVGPDANPDDLARLQDKLNPKAEPGRLSFITRMGARELQTSLPALLEAQKRDGRPVTWMCDPMHGNTMQSSSGYKTRSFERILEEVSSFFAAHAAANTIPGGIHVELTGDDVTEVIGGSEQVTEESLKTRYETRVDPRLNHQQSLELAFQVAEMLQERHDTLGNPLRRPLEPWGYSV